MWIPSRRVGFFVVALYIALEVFAIAVLIAVAGDEMPKSCRRLLLFIAYSCAIPLVGSFALILVKASEDRSRRKRKEEESQPGVRS